jgi:hypothetical protein
MICYKIITETLRFINSKEQTYCEVRAQSHGSVHKCVADRQTAEGDFASAVFLFNCQGEEVSRRYKSSLLNVLVCK